MESPMPETKDNEHAHIAEPTPSAPSRFGRLKSAFHFILWWGAFTSIQTAAANCPFCGQPACAAGSSMAGVSGAFFAAIIQYGGWMRMQLGYVLARVRGARS
jgi:hypothetical protein